MSVEVRPATQDDVRWMVDLAANEGWNPGLRDAEAFRITDPGGFLVATDGDERVGCVSCVRYDERFAFFGFYIVVPERRGAGIGGPLFAAMLERAGERTIGLDGVLDQADRYEAAGFRPAHHSVRWRLDPATADAPGETQAIDTVPFPTLSAFDRRCFPAARVPFLLAWIHTPGHVARAAMHNGVLNGYAVLRPCREGFKIGPLFAKFGELAEALVDDLLGHAGAGPVFLDVPADNEPATALARARGGVNVFESVRMYRGRQPGFDRRKGFGLTTLELG